MTKPSPSSNRTLIEINTTNIQNMKEDIAEIKNQVTNHIPSRIKELDDKVDGLAIKLAVLWAIGSIFLQYFFK